MNNKENYWHFPVVLNNEDLHLNLFYRTTALILVLSVQTLSAEENTSSVPDAQLLDCILEPNKTIEVSSPVEGVISKQYVERGTQVRKGQVVLKLHSELERAALDLAAVQAKFGERTVTRNDEISTLLSDQEKDEIITNAKISKLELNEAQARLNMKTIKSPLNGVVIDVKREEGEYVTEEPVLTMVSINPLHVEVIAPVSFFGKVKKGDELKVLPEQPIGGEYSASVKTVDSVIDAGSGTFRILLKLPNPKGVLPSGLKCRVVF